MGLQVLPERLVGLRSRAMASRKLSVVHPIPCHRRMIVDVPGNAQGTSLSPAHSTILPDPFHFGKTGQASCEASWQALHATLPQPHNRAQKDPSSRTERVQALAVPVAGMVAAEPHPPRASDLALGLAPGARLRYGRAFIAGRSHADSNRRTSSIHQSSW